MEIWKDIKDYEGFYQISNFGRIKSLQRYKQNHSKLQLVPEKIISVHKQYRKNDNEYLNVVLNKNSKEKNKFVHRLVAQAFLENYDEKLQVNHKNGIKYDNRVENLEMVTQSENIRHSIDVLKRKTNGKAILQYDLENNFIREYESACVASRETRICRSCINDCCRNRKKHKTAGGYIWKFK